MAKVNENEEPDAGEGVPEPSPGKREPLLNLPGVITVFAFLIIALHAIRTHLLSDYWNAQLIYMLAFFPASYGEAAGSAPFPMSGMWSPVTHALLHGDWVHVFMNLIWMAAFGSPVARRFGVWRFVILTLICSSAGALAHYVTATNPFIPVIGASGAVSGYMGAAMRFMFSRSRGLRFDENSPAMSLRQCFSHRQFLVFFIIWLGVNYLFGAGFLFITEEGSGIAWQAHIGGFLAGLLVFSVLDPRYRRRGA